MCGVVPPIDTKISNILDKFHGSQDIKTLATTKSLGTELQLVLVWVDFVK